MKFYYVRPIRKLMRPTSKRLRYRRYVAMLLICLVSTICLSAIHKYFFYESNEIIPFRVIEKYYMKYIQLDFNRDITQIWHAKERFKEVKDKYLQSKGIKVLLNGDRKTDQRLKKEYLIYEQTQFNGNSKYCNLFDNKSNFGASIYLPDCPTLNCKFTCDKSKSNSADAVLFNEADLKRIIEENLIHELPSPNRPNSDQVWILWTSGRNPLIKQLDAYKFNWTISYRKDSEVSDCMDGCIFGVRQCFNLNENAAIRSHKKFIENQHQYRTNETVMIVNSDCSDEFSFDFAINFANQYKTSFKGRCRSVNNLELPNFNAYISINTILKSSAQCNLGSLCQIEALRKPKYLFSFEANNCSDHVSKQFWIALESDVIPIVIYPQKVYYEKVAPRNSYIHLQDFDYNPVKLADYLHKIDNNFTLYLQYFAWKFYLFTKYDKQSTESRLMCELCYRLNTENSLIYYNSVSDWFNSTDCN